MVTEIYSHVLDENRRKNMLLFEQEFYQNYGTVSELELKTIHLGATLFGSCLIVRRASKCPQTRMNTGFFIELPVAEYLKISPNIGSFCTQIEPAIRQILDRFLAVTPNTGDSLELSCPII